MKKFIALFIIALFTSCSPYVNITGSWKNSNQPQKGVKTILVASLTHEVVVRSSLEDAMAEALAKYGITVIKGMDEFPPTLTNDTLTKEQIKERVKAKNIDALMSISPIRKETDSRYIPGHCDYTPLIYGHYHYFWAYYVYWYPCVYTPGYYIQNETYFIETNLFDAQSDELLWSVQSETYQPGDLHFFCNQYAKKIADKMKKDGVLNPSLLVNK